MAREFEKIIERNRIKGDYYENIEQEYNLEFIELKANESYNFENYTLTSVELEHGGCKPAYGYLLNKGNITIGYTGDTATNENFLKMCKQTNYMFVDTTTALLGNKKVHVSLEELKEFANTYESCKFYAVHRGDYDTKDKGKVIAPEDGDEIVI